MNPAVAESLGLPVPAAWCVQQLGGRWALVMDRVCGPSFAELLQSNPETMPECVEQMVTLHLRVHACRPVGAYLHEGSFDQQRPGRGAVRRGNADIAPGRCERHARRRKSLSR